MPTRLSPGSLLWLLIAVGAIAFLSFFTPEKTTLFWEALFDAGHAPLFGVIAVALLQFFRRPDQNRIRPYLLAWSVTVLLGVATEASQYFSPRDADLLDLARNVLGATAFLLVALAFERRPRSGSGVRSASRAGTQPQEAQDLLHPKTHRGAWRTHPALLALIALVLLAAAFYPVAAISVAYSQRNAAFPVLCDFESGPMLKFTGVKDGQMSVEAIPAGCGHGRHAAKVTLEPSVYPGFGIREPYPDWTGYEALAFEVFSELPEVVELVLRIHDTAHDRRYEDRFNRAFAIHPGCNSIRVPLSDIREAPEGREMDMTRILGVVLFVVRPEEPLTFYVDAFRLE